MAKYGILIVLAYCVYAAKGLVVINDTTAPDKMTYMQFRGQTVLVSERLMRKLVDEDVTWHWTPWMRTRTQIAGNELKEVVCSDQNSIDSFPDSLFTDEQLRKGAVILYMLFGFYAFTFLAMVCNDYFIPCVEMICEDLKIPQNVAAATFMSVATSCPEFFVNVISTFLTESDMGIGTIVGSAIFNALGVASIGSLAAITPIAIEWKPVTRDVTIYMVNVGILMAIVWDGRVDWYEAIVLGIMYVLYFVIMFNSARIFKLFEAVFGNCNSNKDINVTKNDTKQIENGADNKGFENDFDNNNSEKAPVIQEQDKAEESSIKGIFIYPKDASILSKLWWIYVLPIKIILGFTVPSVVTCRKFYPLAFFMCIIWIGVDSYVVSWCMTVIGHTFFIPDSVMGMTFLALGGCLPEAISIFIMSRRGEGGMGVSNALGANSLAILFALGLPWLIRTLTLLGQGVEEPAVMINSTGIDFVVGSLLLAVSCLWITLCIGRFKLRKSVGFVLVTLYVMFISFAVLVEVGVILDRESFGFCL